MRLKIRILPLALATVGVLLVAKVATLWLEVDAAPEQDMIAVAEALSGIETAAGAEKESEKGEAAAGKAEDGEEKSEKKSASKKKAKPGEKDVEKEHASVSDDETHGKTESKKAKDKGEGADHNTSIGLDDENFDPMMLTRAEIELLQGLSARRAELERREREFSVREHALIAAEKKLDEKIAALGEVKKTVEGLLTAHNKQEDERIKSLVKIYEAMKPKDAARILEGLDPPTLLAVIERMKESKTALVLALLNPDRAKQITEELVARNKLPEPGESKAAASEETDDAGGN